MKARLLAILTGAASGIGWHLAQEFYENGYQVCALDVLPAPFATQA